MADQLTARRRPPAPEPSPTPRRRIDPRFRQRRIDVQRELGRRRLRVLIGVTAVLVALAAGLGVARSPLLAVRRVQVTGAVHVGVPDVVGAAGLAGRHQLIDVRPGSAARAVERLAWVATAVVRREWPSTVRITVTERTPVAIVGEGAGAMEVDPTGRVLGPLAPGAHLPAVRLRAPSVGGPAPVTAGQLVDARIRPGIDVAGALPPELAGSVDAVVVGDGDDVHLQLSGGVDVVLGGTADLRPKLVAVLTLLAHQKLSPGVLDVSVPAAPVLTPTGPVGNFSTHTGG